MSNMNVQAKSPLAGIVAVENKNNEKLKQTGYSTFIPVPFTNTVASYKAANGVGGQQVGSANVTGEAVETPGDMELAATPFTAAVALAKKDNEKVAGSAVPQVNKSTETEKT